MRRLGLISIFTFLFMFLILPAANAQYIDPGSASSLFTIIAVAVAGIGAFFITFRNKIASLFRKRNRDKTKV